MKTCMRILVALLVASSWACVPERHQPLPSQLDLSHLAAESLDLQSISDADFALLHTAAYLRRNGTSRAEALPYARIAEGAWINMEDDGLGPSFFLAEAYLHERVDLPDGCVAAAVTTVFTDPWGKRECSANQVVYRDILPEPTDFPAITRRLVAVGRAEELSGRRWTRAAARALRGFQQDHGLEATGRPDTATLKALFPPGTCMEVLEFTALTVYPPRPNIEAYILPLEEVEQNPLAFSQGFGSRDAILEHALTRGQADAAMVRGAEMVLFVMFMDHVFSVAFHPGGLFRHAPGFHARRAWRGAVRRGRGMARGGGTLHGGAEHGEHLRQRLCERKPRGVRAAALNPIPGGAAPPRGRLRLVLSRRRSGAPASLRGHWTRRAASGMCMTIRSSVQPSLGFSCPSPSSFPRSTCGSRPAPVCKAWPVAPGEPPLAWSWRTTAPRTRPRPPATRWERRCFPGVSSTAAWKGTWALPGAATPEPMGRPRPISCS